MRISDWSSDVCSSDLAAGTGPGQPVLIELSPNDQRSLRADFRRPFSPNLRHGVRLRFGHFVIGAGFDVVDVEIGMNGIVRTSLPGPNIQPAAPGDRGVRQPPSEATDAVPVRPSHAVPYLASTCANLGYPPLAVAVYDGLGHSS